MNGTHPRPRSPASRQRDGRDGQASGDVAPVPADIRRVLEAHAALMPGPPVQRPDVDRALDEARDRLGVTAAARRRDGTPREQFALDVGR